MTCQELCLDAVMTEGERWETFCSACTCYGFVWLFAWREALFRFREWQWRLWSRDNVIEFACDNVTILEAWNVALLSSDIGWWYSRGTETAVSVPGMLAVKQVGLLHWRLVMCHKLSVLIEVSSCLAVLPRWCFFEATYRHCRQSRVVLSEHMCIQITACRCEQCLQQQQQLQCAVRVTCLVLRLYNLSFNEAPDSLQAVYLQAWRYHDHRHPPRVLSRRLDNRRPSTKWTTT